MELKRFIYADNAATTKLDIDAFEAMRPFLLNEYANASQPYSFARAAKNALDEARKTIAACINATPEEIFFTSGGTESDNWAIKGSAFSDSNYCATITSQIEHHAVLNACHAIERLHYPVAYLDATCDGEIRPEELEQTINGNTRLVSIMMVNNEIGTIQPIQALSEVAHSYGALFHTDAVQGLGHISVNVQDLGVDMLSASAHKFNGPKGIGFLFVRKGAKIIPFLDGGAQEFGFRAGTENIASIVGMSVALKKNCTIMATNTAHLLALEKILLGKLTQAGVDFKRNGGKIKAPGNISISFRGADGETLLHRLDLLGICVSTGSACDSKNTQISHVLKAINLPLEYAQGTIRVSFGRENTKEDAEILAKSLVNILRNI